MSRNSFNIDKSLRLKPINLATLINPKNGELAIDINDLNKLKKYNESNSTWEDVSATSSSSNYILNSTAEVDTTGWVRYANTAGVAPITGAGGSPNVNTTFTRSTVDPQRGVASFLLTKDAVNRQGEGFSYDFTISNSDQGKVLTCSFSYSVTANYVDNDMSVWIYDVTNARIIQGAPYLIKKSGIIEYFSTEFQTSINSTSYRLIFHITSTSTLDYSFKFDQVNLSKQAKLYGSAITDWVSYVPIISTASGTMTNVTATGKWRRIGDTAEIQFRIVASGSTGTWVLPSISLPSGLSVDTNKKVGLFGASIGNVALNNTADNTYFNGKAYIATGNTVTIAYSINANGSATVFNQGSPFTFDAADTIEGSVTVPIQGWSSSQQLSNDADTRVVSANVYRTSVQSGQVFTASSAQKLQLAGVFEDSHGAYDGVTNYRYTVKVPGTYVHNLNLLFSSAYANSSIGIALRKNGQIISYSFTTLGSVSVIVGANPTFKDTAKAGDYYEIFITPTTEVQMLSTASIQGGSQWSITKLSGPSQIAASESVACSYYNVAGTAIGTGIVTVPFPTKYFDTHNALNPATGVFTAPISGVYLITTAITSEALNLSTNQGFYSNIRKGGLDISSSTSWGNGVTKRQETRSSIMVPLLAGETISIVSSSNVATTLSTGSQSHNNISIFRVGNY